MSQPTNTIEAASGTENTASALAQQGDQMFVLSAALLTGALRNADYDDLEALAAGDDDAFGSYIDRAELGNFVYEHTVDYFQEIAKNELVERNEGAKDAWEVETELRGMTTGGNIGGGNW